MTPFAEKQCTRCNKTWPRDAEFFRQETRGNRYYLPWCRVCEAEQKREKRARKSGEGLT